jgi:hyperosmotically inducible protein
MAAKFYLCKDTKMLKMRTTRKALPLGMLFGALLGCGDSDTTLTGRDSTVDDGVTVTANKPVVTDPVPSTTTPDSNSQETNTAESPTNTDVNDGDLGDSSKTPVDENDNPADVQRTADIRSKLGEAELSADAKKVTIITEEGKVTLKGQVPSADEKSRVEAIARDIAGDDNVDSQLEVSPN